MPPKKSLFPRKKSSFAPETRPSAAGKTLFPRKNRISPAKSVLPALENVFSGRTCALRTRKTRFGRGKHTFSRQKDLLRRRTDASTAGKTFFSAAWSPASFPWHRGCRHRDGTEVEDAVRDGSLGDGEGLGGSPLNSRHGLPAFDHEAHHPEVVFALRDAVPGLEGAVRLDLARDRCRGWECA